jgi:hypothetical protein
LDARGYLLDTSMRPYRLIAGCALALGLTFGAQACAESILPSALYDNVVDTVSLYALDGTPVATRSGYNLIGRQAVRTDLTSGFDFVFNIDSLGRALLIPGDALNMEGGAGFLEQTVTFTELRSAPAGTYITERGIVVVPGQVLAARSRLASCAGLGNLPYYAKIGVIAVDPGERRISFEILTNINCGYRSLQPGRPTS